MGGASDILAPAVNWDERFGQTVDEIYITSFIAVIMTSLLCDHLLSPVVAYYPYYYGSGGGFGGMYWIIFLGTLALSLIAQFLVSHAYSKYSQVPAASGLTGAQVAQRILETNGITDVSIQMIPGKLTDHYDPRTKTLNLSEGNYTGRSVAAIGVSAHECGHALQHQRGYQPLEWRMAAVGVTRFASSLIFWIPMLGIFLHIISIKTSITIVALAWGILMLFQLVTLPVEFDATARAKRILPQLGVVSSQEMVGVNRVLDAAALTYVAAFISSLAYFLYYLLRMLGNSRN
jgi:uncharacterized protein